MESHRTLYSKSELARLQELTTTRFVESHGVDDEIETTRAIGSDFRGDDVITAEGCSDNVILVEDRRHVELTTPVHGIDDTPKLVAKQRKTPMRAKSKDEASQVLSKIKSMSRDDLQMERFDYYAQKWYYTTTVSEMRLSEYVLRHPNARPYFFSMQCRKLSLHNFAQLLTVSQSCEPMATGQSVVRLAIKISHQFTFEDFLEMIYEVREENSGFVLEDVSVVATMTENTNKTTTVHRMTTKDYEEYARLESNMDESSDLMSSRVSMTCKSAGKEHVVTQLTYYNNGSYRDEYIYRNRYVELEQTVKCRSRRVLFDETKNESVEFEVESRMVPLKMGIPHVEDLISFLKTGLLEIEKNS